MAKLPYSKSENKSTDEDYESDDSEIDKLKTTLVDPVDDKDLVDDLCNITNIVLKYGDDSVETLLTSGCYLFVAETDDDGPLAGIFLSDGKTDNKGRLYNMKFATQAYSLNI